MNGCEGRLRAPRVPVRRGAQPADSPTGRPVARMGGWAVRRLGGWAVGRSRVFPAAATALLALVWWSAAPGALLGAQELADYDYENLAFRGLGLETGYIFPTRVEGTSTFGVRMDLGYLGPSVRIVPGIAYWSSRMKRDQVRELEVRVEELVDREAPPGSPPASVNLGTIDWSDIVLSLDAHVVWHVPFGFLTFAGVGAAAHVLNGGGEAIAGTFVEDLLDTVTAGANLHAGIEYPVIPNLRLYGVTRLEVVENLQYAELRLGGQFLLGGAASAEVRR